jgi:hypothetical protein
MCENMLRKNVQLREVKQLENSEYYARNPMIFTGRLVLKVKKRLQCVGYAA